MANTEASLALAESSQSIADGCEEGVDEEGKPEISIATAAKRSVQLEKGAGAPPRLDGQRGFGFGEKAPDGGVITSLVRATDNDLTPIIHSNHFPSYFVASCTIYVVGSGMAAWHGARRSRRSKAKTNTGSGRNDAARHSG